MERVRADRDLILDESDFYPWGHAFQHVTGLGKCLKLICVRSIPRPVVYPLESKVAN